MAIEVNNVWLYRIIPLGNLENNLRNGLFAKRSAPQNTDYISLGNQDIINRRDSTVVKCFPATVVNDYVPLYFSVRTPMLYNIIKGNGVKQVEQENIIYLCFRLTDLVGSDLVWCFTDGNAAVRISSYFCDLQDLPKLDWHSIQTDDFRLDNADNDPDRIRKKHAEFLVKNHVPISYIKQIIVLNKKTGKEVTEVLAKCNLKIDVFVNPNNKFYF
jgi:hypothetical protein